MAWKVAWNWEKTAVFDPTCTICGITTGYQGPGSMTVLPAKASAKIDFRLVPNQTPEEVVSKLRLHLDTNGFEDVEITLFGNGRPAKVDPNHPLVKIGKRHGTRCLRQARTGCPDHWRQWTKLSIHSRPWSPCHHSRNWLPGCTSACAQ